MTVSNFGVLFISERYFIYLELVCDIRHNARKLSVDSFKSMPLLNGRRDLPDESGETTVKTLAF
jgi:hypothetical protein